MKRVVELPPLPPRPVEGHKGLFGRVLVAGGSDGMIGAPVLAGSAALRCGAGLVQLAVPRPILPFALSITPELIGLALARGTKRDKLLSAAAEQADAVVVGPGIGQSPAARARVWQLLSIARPTVIDADALNILAAEKRWPVGMKARAVLTPHPGEMRRLAKLLGKHGRDVPADERERIDFAASAARTLKQVLVLKGHRTVVTDGDRVYLNRTGDSSLSKAGSGDVLSGVIGCFLAQHMEPLDAAVAGVRIHGRAGELAGSRLGRRCVLAREVIGALPEAIREYEATVGG